MISPTALGSITSYLDRLKQGTGSGAGLEDLAGGGNRFASLMKDPMLQMGNVQSLLGMEENGGGSTPSERAITGSMGLMNAKALATLSKVVGNQQSPMSGMYRDLLQSGVGGMGGGSDIIGKAMEVAKAAASFKGNAVQGADVSQPSYSVRMPVNQEVLSAGRTASEQKGMHSQGKSQEIEATQAMGQTKPMKSAGAVTQNYAQALHTAHNMLSQQISRAAGGNFLNQAGMFGQTGAAGPFSAPTRVAGPSRFSAAKQAYGIQSMGNAARNPLQSALNDLRTKNQFTAPQVAPTQQSIPAAPVSAPQARNTSQAASAVPAAPKESAAEVAKLRGYRPGSLAALFESGSRGGLGAVGYDRVGGTSYGKYQLSSRAGTMDAFLTFLDRKAPEMSERLRGAGQANTGSRSGQMPQEWQKLARTNPARFERLQDDFIHNSNYTPAFKAVTSAMGVQDLNPAMQEVLFSTSVQHGPTGAVRIFAKAFDRVGGLSESNEKDFIRNVYSVRAGQFGSSSSGVRRAVHGRLAQEMRAALSLLQESSLV